MFLRLLLSAILIYAHTASAQEQNDTHSSLSFLEDTVRVLGELATRCLPHNNTINGKETLQYMDMCFKRKTLLALDRLLSENVIYLTDNIQLVKYKNDSSKASGRKFENGGDWRNKLMGRLADVLDTHKLQINFLRRDFGVEGRRRRRGAMPMLIFTTIALGMITIPMGFQFLAVLGGKALLLAKLALILSAIQGLKKIATSDVHYGLYHLPSANPWKDRKWFYDLTMQNHPEKFNPYINQHEDASTHIEHTIRPPLDPRF